jgi:hypothetical protein
LEKKNFQVEEMEDQISELENQIVQQSEQLHFFNLQKNQLETDFEDAKKKMLNNQEDSMDSLTVIFQLEFQVEKNLIKNFQFEEIFKLKFQKRFEVEKTQMENKHKSEIDRLERNLAEISKELATVRERFDTFKLKMSDTRAH